MSDLLTLEEWSNDVDGRYIVWSINGAQCVDLAKDKAIRCDGAPNGAYGHGMDMARGLSRLEGWKYSGPNGDAKPGMIVSGLPEEPWNKKYGHVFTLLQTHSDGSWTIKDQNPRPALTRRIMPSAIAGMVEPPARPAAVKLEAATSATTHTVKAGDTVGKLAARYGVKIDQIRTWNNLRDVNLIEVGQRLVIQEPRPRYVITWELANIFTGPGTNYRKINKDYLKKGLPLVATGRTANGWVELSTPYMQLSGATGWIWGEAVKKVS